MTQRLLHITYRDRWRCPCLKKLSGSRPQPVTSLFTGSLKDGTKKWIVCNWLNMIEGLAHSIPIDNFWGPTLGVHPPTPPPVVVVPIYMYISLHFQLHCTLGCDLNFGLDIHCTLPKPKINVQQPCVWIGMKNLTSIFIWKHFLIKKLQWFTCSETTSELCINPEMLNTCT